MISNSRTWFLCMANLIFADHRMPAIHPSRQTCCINSTWPVKCFGMPWRRVSFLFINSYCSGSNNSDFLQQQSGLKMIVNKYREALDKSLGLIYRQRKDYEQTVTMINERISAYLGQQQVHAQLMFPHYFEKYKTDGVE